MKHQTLRTGTSHTFLSPHFVESENVAFLRVTPARFRPSAQIVAEVEWMQTCVAAGSFFFDIPLLLGE